MLVARILVGSHAYGMALPESDRDYVSVHFPTSKTILGLERAARVSGDNAHYILHDYVRMMLGKAINLFEPLFMEPAETDGHWWERLVEIRDAFIWQGIARSATGYIVSELGRIERQRRWLKGDVFPDEEKSFSHFKPDRLIHKYGWDVKAAAHCLRLVFELNELEETGAVQFPLKGANALLTIRTGGMSYEAFSDLMAIQQYDWTLSEEPDLERVEDYLAGVYQAALTRP
jgi:predicted nucleotidyltransferase